MIEFRPLELEDKERIQHYTLNSRRQNCDLSFANLFSWRFYYRTQWAEWRNFLLFRFQVGDGQLAYMMPVGEGSLKSVVEAMMEDAQHQGVPFLMLGVCAGMRAELESEFPERFDFQLDRDYFDYIYLRSDLASLRGKKFQSKRNHINRFKAAYPGYEYKELTPDLVPECLRLENSWCKANDCAENRALLDERCSMTTALQHIEQLDIQGGVLYVDGRMVAFTYGAPINADTFDTCVEKADTDIDGSYAMINYEFARRIPEQYTFINREEDLGLEGLRKAKLSYQPEVLLEKYVVTLK